MILYASFLAFALFSKPRASGDDPGPNVIELNLDT